MKTLLMIAVLLAGFSLAHSQVTLQPWVEVFGSTNGQQLGKYVTGITPSANLPYKAAVSKVGSTGIYRLNSPSDTSVQRVFFGENLLTGDLNNDGFKDVVVVKTVVLYDTVYIYWGTASGLDTLNPLKIAGENQDDQFRPGCIGDINNDGKPDLILTAWGAGVFDSGKVYIFLNPIHSPLPNAVIVGDTVSYHLGRTCAVGDLNNDGFNDLIIRGNKTGGSQATWYDYANIYWGLGPDTLNTRLDLHLKTQNLNSAGLAVFDVNGDGRTDLLWTTTQSSINIHFGSTNFDTLPSLRLQMAGSPTAGFTITNAGDMNGDGFNDIAVGDPRASISSGIVRIYAGGPNIDGVFDAAVSRGSESGFGTSVASLGDINGDGLSDIIVGAPNDPFFNDRGYWGIFKGDSTIRVTDVKEENTRPNIFVVHQCYPNPFNPQTTIEYNLHKRAFVTLKVYNILGEDVRTLINEEQEAGEHSVKFQAYGLAAGVYFYEIVVKTIDGTIARETKKMILLSELEKQGQDEYERLLLTKGLAGDEAAFKELSRLRYEHAGGRLKQFLMDPDDVLPDSVIQQRLQQLGVLR